MDFLQRRQRGGRHRERTLTSGWHSRAAPDTGRRVIGTRVDGDAFTLAVNPTILSRVMS